MAGSARDEGKRAAVRRLLRAKKWQAASDRAVAAAAGVGRYLVRSVRQELIAAGLIDPPPADPTCYSEERAGRYGRPGTVARGGYVFDETGRVVRADVWQKRQKAERRGR